MPYAQTFVIVYSHMYSTQSLNIALLSCLLWTPGIVLHCMYTQYTQLLTSDSSCLILCLSITQPCSNILHTLTYVPCNRRYPKMMTSLWTWDPAVTKTSQKSTRPKHIPYGTIWRAIFIISFRIYPRQGWWGAVNWKAISIFHMGQNPWHKRKVGFYFKSLYQALVLVGHCGAWHLRV